MATRNPSDLIDDLESATARIRYDAGRQLQILSHEKPTLLYPHWDSFVGLLDSPRAALGWMAAAILAELVRVDTAKKFDKLFPRYFRPIREKVMITAANIIRDTPRIVAARPDLADKIVRKILKVQSARYQTPTCRDIAIGHAVIALGEIFPYCTVQPAVLRFIAAAMINDRPGTRKKAEEVMAALRKARLAAAATTKSAPGRNKG